MPPKAGDGHDVVVKLLLIGDSGVGKSCLLLRFADDSFTSSFITTIGIDFKIRKLQIGEKLVKVQIWDTAGQERFRTITAAYYRNAMAIILVYDITDEGSFNNIKGWMRNIEQHASENVNKILVGNKSDMSDRRAVPYARGKALADEYKLMFFETSAKSSTNVDEVFTAISKQVIQRLEEADAQTIQQAAAHQQATISLAHTSEAGAGKKGSSCC